MALLRVMIQSSVQGDSSGDLLVVGWGGTYGAISSATKMLQDEGFAISSIHLRHPNPLPEDLETLLSSFEKVIVPELNLGQLWHDPESKVC